jgi:DNA-binding LacI/PurR family transcriptional regulator
MSTPRVFQPVSATPGRPLYEAVSAAVLHAVDSGKLRPGDQLPNTKVLSDDLGVSVVTVHRALQHLVGRGVLRRGQGKGTFVHENYLDPEHKPTDTRFGVVFHDESSLADSYHGQVLEGVRRGGLELGVDLVLLRYGEDWRKECQGFVYVNPLASQLERSPRDGSARRRNGPSFPPSVVIGARWAQPGVMTVDTDNVALARQAVLHLHRLGHQRIAYVGGTSDLSNNADRLAGFRAAVGECRLAWRDEWAVLENGWKLDGGSSSRLAALFAEPAERRPTAVFAAGYYFALDVFRVAAECSLKVPSDVSVVGVDDPPSAALLSPGLTTFRQPLVQIGHAAARALFDRIAAGDASNGAGPAESAVSVEHAGVGENVGSSWTGSNRLVFDAELILRGSTGCPGHRAESGAAPGVGSRRAEDAGSVAGPGVAARRAMPVRARGMST